MTTKTMLSVSVVDMGSDLHRQKTGGANAAIKRRLERMLWSASDLFRRLELALRLVI